MQQTSSLGWNHRIIKHNRDGRVSCQIHAVFYDAEGNPDSWTEEAAFPFGESFNELRIDLELQRLAFGKPVLLVDSDGEKEILRECEPEIMMQDRWLEHEAMDRSAQFIEIFHSQVASHPVTAQNKELKKQAEVVINEMTRLYQMTAE